MAFGLMIESSIAATNIDAYNRYAIGNFDVAGGGLVSLAPPSVQGDDRWTATVPATGALGGLYMAYNPSEKYTVIGTGSTAKYYAGLSADPRDYTNLANRTYTVFKPKLGDEVVITIDCVDSTGANAVRGDFLEAKNGQTLLARVAQATGATAGSTAFQIEWVGTLPFPQAGIGFQQVKAIKMVCVQE